MKKNYPFKAYISLIFIVSLFLNSHAQSPGDIAFIAFNADGDDDFAIVALTELAANSTIYITDNESDGAGGITSGEGTLTWFTSPKNAASFLEWFEKMPCYQLTYSNNELMYTAIKRIFEDEL